MKTKDWLAFITLSLAWGSSFFWIKIAVQDIGPFMLVALRVLFGLLGLLVVMLIRRPTRPSDWRTRRALLILGITNTALPFVLISWAEQYMDSAVASILNSSVAVFIALFAHFVLPDDRLTRNRILGVLVGFAGVITLVGRDLASGVTVNLLAQGAMILAVLFYAGSAIFARINLKGLSPVVQALVPLISADAFLWTLTPIVESPLRFPTLPITWVALLWLGLIGSCTAYLLYYYLLHSVGPTRMAMVAYSFPVVGVFLGVLFLNEALDIYVISGAALIVGSLYIVNRK